MFSTPNFRGKTAATIWMLFLALAIVLVDYFAGPVNTSRGWQMEVLWSRLDNPSDLYYIPDDGLYVRLADSEKVLWYNPKNREKKETSIKDITKKLETLATRSDMVILDDQSRIELEYAERQGRLIKIDALKTTNQTASSASAQNELTKETQQKIKPEIKLETKKEAIVRRLHQPMALRKDNDNNLYLIELGRSRILKFSHD